MASYAYLALDNSGKEVKGFIQGVDEKDVANQLRNNALFMLSAKLSERDGSGQSNWMQYLAYLNPRYYLGVKMIDLVLFCRQLSLMVGAGHTIIETLEAVHSMVEKPKLQRTIKILEQDVRAGQGFSQALAKHPSIFSEYFISLIAAGEQTGELDQVLLRLAEDFKNRVEIKRQITMAILRPTITFLSSLMVLTFLVTYAIPRIGSMLERNGGDMPATTQFMLDTADFLFYYYIEIGVIISALVIFFISLTQFHAGRFWLHQVLLYMPFAGRISLSNNLTQLAWTLSLLIRSGVSIVDALKISEKVVSNLTFKRCMHNASEKILSGASLSQATAVKPLPEVFSHMTAIGERSGEIESVMNELGMYYYDELKLRINKAVLSIDLILLLVVGSIVAFVLLSVYGAIYATAMSIR